MNVELINPAAVHQLFAGSDAGVSQPRHPRAPNWGKRLRRRLEEALRYRRALYQLRQLDQRDLDDLDLARTNFPALARRHARGLEPLARPC